MRVREEEGNGRGGAGSRGVHQQILVSVGQGGGESWYINRWAR